MEYVQKSLSLKCINVHTFFLEKLFFLRSDSDRSQILNIMNLLLYKYYLLFLITFSLGVLKFLPLERILRVDALLYSELL